MADFEGLGGTPSIARQRYNLMRENQAAMKRVNDLASETTARALSDLGGLAQNEVGGLLREVVPGIVDQFGNVNANIAIDYYGQQRELAFKALEGQYSGRYGVRKAANRRAQAQLKAAAYNPQLPEFDAAAKSESIIGFGMKTWVNGGDVAGEVSNAVTREVASYNRDTILYNSALDPEVTGVQRVAEPNACDFCQMVAFDSYGSARVSGYAADYHNNCHCSIETLYRGDAPVRPDYYDEFEYGNIEASKNESSADTRSFFQQNPDQIPVYLRDNKDFMSWLER